MAVVTGTVGLAFFKERLPNANKEHKNSYTRLNKKLTAQKANTRHRLPGTTNLTYPIKTRQLCLVTTFVEKKPQCDNNVNTLQTSMKL